MKKDKINREIGFQLQKKFQGFLLLAKHNLNKCCSCCLNFYKVCAIVNSSNNFTSLLKDAYNFRGIVELEFLKL